jgi:hypothetical protein
MRKCFAFLVVVLFLAGTAATTLAATERTIEKATQALQAGERVNDFPARAPSALFREGVPETTYYGYIDADGKAILGETWTWDHGDTDDPFEGWHAEDQTAQSAVWFRHIDADTWALGDNLVDAPILRDQGSAWCGAMENEADALCWDAGLGYGNSWCQRLTSPVQDWTAGSSASLQFVYFNDSELNFDYTHVILSRDDQSEVPLNFDGFTDQIGLASDHPASPPVGATFSRSLADIDMDEGAPDHTISATFQIVFEFTSDGGWSDEDAQYTTEYGPFAADNVSITGPGVTDVTYQFENDLDNWVPSGCPGIGTFFGLADISTYDIQDPCDCELEGTVLEMHDDSFEHPEGQRIFCISNEFDPPDASGGDPTLQNSIFAQFDLYAELPLANGVLYRPGYIYYPYVCDAVDPPPPPTWSPRTGQAVFYYAGGEPTCARSINSATGTGVPADCQAIKFVFEILGSCDQFGIPPSDCSGVTNFSPLVDNVMFGLTTAPKAPPVQWEPGRFYQDGFVQSFTLDVSGHGNADCSTNINFGNTPPFVLADQIRVNGPDVVNGQNNWNADLYFRIVREGPSPNTEYNNWKTEMGVTSVGPDVAFTHATMDSFQVGPVPIATVMLGYLSESDPRFDAGAGELTDENEIIEDWLPPGTKIEYFVASYFTASPNVRYTLPDTLGAFFNEFEILPSWRDDGGTDKFPCTLYIDAYNRGSEFYITNALDENGIPWDKYDYLDSSSNYVAPMNRLHPGDDNGVPTPQLMGYRVLLINTGIFDQACWPEDYALWSDWLTYIECDGTLNRQLMIMNGDNMGGSLEANGANLLANQLDADRINSNYQNYSNDLNFCIPLEWAGSGGYDTRNSINDPYAYDGFGNWCPNRYAFDVFSAIGTGVGNRVFASLDSGIGDTEFAQVVNDVTGGGSDNFRTVLDGVSYHHMSEQDPVEECVGDSAHIVTAAFNEITAALEWAFDGAGAVPGLCVNPCTTVGVDDHAPAFESGKQTRLYQNSPNPFNPRTTLKFSLAQTGKAELVIYDVNGRKVKTLVNGQTEAGLHEVVWDGTDDAGHPVASGVFWSQLSTETYNSNKKMVVLR